MTETFNPIKGKEEYNGRKRLGSERPRPNVSTALVFVKDGGIVESIVEGKKVNWGILIWSPYDSMYEVDLAPCQITFQIDALPSKDSATKKFEAEITFSCKVDVDNMEPIIKEKITNVNEIFFPRVETVIRNTSNAYFVTEINHAESAICKSLQEKISAFARSKGFIIADINIKLTLNNEAQVFLADLEKANDSLIRNKEQHKVDSQSVSHQSELEKMKATYSIEIEKLKQQNEMEIMQQKMTFYEQVIKNGGLDAYRLAQNPNAAEKIRHEQIQGEILSMKFRLEGFVSLAETGAIATPELAEHAKRLLASNLFNNSSPSGNMSELSDGISQNTVEESQPNNQSDTDTDSHISKSEIENPNEH
jgi:hypothetical protein